MINDSCCFSRQIPEHLLVFKFLRTLARSLKLSEVCCIVLLHVLIPSRKYRQLKPSAVKKPLRD